VCVHVCVCVCVYVCVFVNLHYREECQTKRLSSGSRSVGVRACVCVYVSLSVIPTAPRAVSERGGRTGTIKSGVSGARKSTAFLAASCESLFVCVCVCVCLSECVCAREEDHGLF